jgi:hypothetical protein
MGHDSRTGFWMTIVGLLRRKRVVIPAIVVAILGGVTAYAGTPVSYVSSTTMVLTTTQFGGTESQDPTKPTDLTNPMLNFNDSLRTTSAILIESMNTKDVAEQLGVRGSTTLIVNDGRTNPNLLGSNGPFLYIVGRSPSSAETQRVVAEAQKLMQKQLLDLQNALNAPEKTYVSLVNVVAPNTPEPDASRATKLAMMAFVLGFGLTVGIAYFGQRFRARRRARAAVRAAVAGPPPVGDQPPTKSLAQPARRPSRRPSRRPVLAPEDEPGAAEPLVASFPRTAGPTTGPTPGPTPGPSDPQRERDVELVPTSLRKKSGPVLVPVPVKSKVRSRNS